MRYEPFFWLVAGLCLGAGARSFAGSCGIDAHIEAIGAGTNVTKYGFAALLPSGSNPKIYFKKKVTTGSTYAFDEVGTAANSCFSCHESRTRTQSDTWEYLSGLAFATAITNSGLIEIHKHDKARSGTPAVDFDCVSHRTNAIMWDNPTCTFLDPSPSDTNTFTWTEDVYRLVLTNYTTHQIIDSESGEVLANRTTTSSTSTETLLTNPYSLSDFLSTALGVVSGMPLPDWTNATRYGVAERGGASVAPGSATNAPPSSFSARVSKFRYRVSVLGPKREKAFIHWFERFTPQAGTNIITTTNSVEVTFTGEPQYVDITPGVTEKDVPPPSTPGRTEVYMDRHDTSCSSTSCRSFGAGETKTSCIEVRMSLGVNAFGEQAGYLMVHEDEPSVDLYSTTHLKLFSNHAGEVINSGGALRQIKTPQGLVDIVTTASGYEVRFYLSAGAVAGGLYTPVGTPSVTWRFENPDISNTKLTVTEIRGSDSKVSSYEWSAVDSAWSLIWPGGLGKETRSFTVSGNVRTETYSLSSTNGALAFKETKLWQIDSGLGDLLISHTVGADGDSLTTAYSWYTNATDAHNYGQLKTMIRPGGGWETNTYTNGRISKVVSSFGNSALDSAEGNHRVTIYSYAPVDGIDDGTLSTNTPRQVIETIQGYDMRKMYRVISPGKSIEAVVTLPGTSSWSDPSNLFTTNRTLFSVAFDGTTESSEFPDGTMQLSQNSRVVDGQWLTNTTWRGQPNGSHTAVTNGMKTIERINPTGQTVSRVTSDIATGIVIAREDYGYSDAYSLPASVTTLDGRTVSTGYDCCNVLSTTDKEGVGSSFTYDAIKRLVATKRNGIITSNVLDAAGNVVAILRIGQDASVIALETNSYGPSGRLFAHADAMTNLTIYSYISETNKTTFYANTGTRIESTLADGMKSRITGTATHPVSYEYFPDSGVFYTIEYKLADDGDLVSAEWTSPAIDMAGRQALFYYSDLRAVEFIYNTKGQLTRSVDLDNITNLYAYNSRGELELRGIDMDGSGTLTTNSTDRLTQALVDYVFNGAANVRRTRTVLYATNNTTATVVLTNDVSVDGLRTWSYQYGLTSSTKTEYGSGTRKVTETRPDGATSVAFYQSGWLRWVADNDANGSLLRKTVYEYDPHGRPFLVTDARNGTTTNTFNNADQVQSVSTPSPGADQPSQVTTTYYDNMGQVWRVVLPDASSVTNLYWPSGELKQTSGSRTYPVRYAYDRQGRMTGMTNWSDFALASESRATTWSYHPVRGWLTGKTYPDSTQVGYIYTLAGKLYRRTWARSITTTYGYNAAGDLATITYSDGTTPNIGFGYDRRGRRISVANGAMTTTFALNQAGQVLTESYSGGPLSGLTVTNTFDGLLRRTNVATVGLKTGYSYDAASRMQTVTHGTDSATYNYVANSPLVQDVFFKHNATTQMTTSRQYDRLNRLTQIGSLSSAAVAFTYNYGYNSANQRTNRLEADGSHWDYGYDSLGEVTSGKKKWDASATNFVAGQQFEYTFDDIGNRKQTKAGGDASGNNLRTSVYSANTLNQITNRTVPNQFDVIGSVAASAGVSVNGQTNVLRHGEYFQYLFTTNNSAGAVYPGVTNQAAFTAGTNLVIGNVFLPKDAEVFAYDADGNQTNDGRWALTWDAENRLIAMESRTNAPDASKRKLQFTYDWMGRRISKVVQTWTTNSTWTMTFSNRFLYDGWNLIAELSDANLPLQTFAWGLDLSGTLRRAGGVGGLLIASFNPHNYNDYILENTNWVFSTKNQYFAYDGNGNVMAMMDANAGTASAQYEYGPFGEAIRVTGSLAKLNPIRFSTKYTDDENEAVYYGYRYLVNGRWLSRDPMEEQDVPNLYCFVGNSPSVIIDRSGLERWKDIPDPPGYVNPRKTVPRQFTMEEIEESNAWWEGFWESVSEDLFGETIEMPDGSRREKFMTGTPPDIGFASVGKMSRLLRCCRNTRFKLLEEVTWSSYAGKHTSSRNVPWKKIVEATTTGPAKYRPGINIRQLEEAVWKNGTPVCNGKPWKVAEFSSDIGASGGRASRWVRVEESGGAIHGHPITPEEFYKLLGK